MTWSTEHQQNIHQTSIIAIPKHERSTKAGFLEFPITDTASWVYVEEKLETYKQSGKTDLEVILIYGYSHVYLIATQAPQGHTQSSTPPPSSQQLYSRDFSISSSATASRGTPTQRQLQEQAIEHTVYPEQADSEAWATRWTCRSNTCDFRGKFC